MPSFSNNQNLLNRCEILMDRLHRSLGTLKDSGKFGNEFSSRLDIKQLLNERGACDFENQKIELKTIYNKGGRITLFEVTKDEFLEWKINPISFIRKFGTDELGDGWTRLDRDLSGIVNSTHLVLSYKKFPIVSVPLNYILYRFNIKCQKIVLVEGSKIAPKTVKWHTLTYVETPPFTADTLLKMLETKKIKIESRIKCNKRNKLIHRLIFRTTSHNMKTMTPKTKTLINLSRTKKPDPKDFTMLLNDEVYSSTIPKGYGIKFEPGNEKIKMFVTEHNKTSSVEITAEILTPFKANQYLEILDVEKQRKVRKTRVRSLKLALEKGRGVLTGDSLIISNGKLIQGQHRCWAVIESGIPMIVTVMRTTDEDLYDMIDAVLPRSFADRVSKDIPMAKSIGAAINLIRRYDQGVNGTHGLTLWGGDVLHCHSDQKAYFDEHKENLLESMEIAKEGNKIVFSTAVGIAFLQLAWREKSDRNKATKFIEQLIDCTNLRSGSAVHTLRKWLQKENADSRTKFRTEPVFAEIVTAWNCFCKNKPYSAPKPARINSKKTKRSERKFPRLYWETVPKAKKLVTV